MSPTLISSLCCYNCIQDGQFQEEGNVCSNYAYRLLGEPAEGGRDGTGSWNKI